MDAGDTIALVAVVGMVIAITITVTSMFSRFMKYKERQLGTTADATAEKAAQYASHVEHLEARVRVLERIATDKGADLAQQIEDLRDEPHSLTKTEGELN